MHKQIKEQIERKNARVATRVNQTRRRITFQPGDWLWIHLRKERFPHEKISKLQPRDDGPFEVLEKIGDNAYKVDLRGKYNVSSTFNVADLSLYDSTDSWSNPLQEGEEDAAKPNAIPDPLRVPIGPITRSKSNQLRQLFIGYVQRWWQLNESPSPNEAREDIEYFNYICVILGN